MPIAEEEKLVSMIRNSDDERVEERNYRADCEEQMILLENATEEHLLPSQNCQEHDMTKD